MINRFVIYGSVRNPAEHAEWMDAMRDSFAGDEAEIKSVLEELDRRGSIPMQIGLMKEEKLTLAGFIPQKWEGKYIEHRISASPFYDRDKRPFTHFSCFVGPVAKETKFPLYFGAHLVTAQFAICGWDQIAQEHKMLHCAACCEEFVLWLNEMQNTWRDATLPAAPKEATHVAPTRLQ